MYIYIYIYLYIYIDIDNQAKMVKALIFVGF